MKSLLLLTLSLFIISPTLFSQSITIGEDGIVRCKDVPIGTTEDINDVTYEVVDRALLEQRRDEGADLTKSCVSNVTDMGQVWNEDSTSVIKQGIFHQKDFNQKINNWDVSNVTDMSSMFSSSTFNQDISNWDVSNVKSMNRMFLNANDFNQNIGDWNIINVLDMAGMLNKTSFNQSISEWNVKNVRDMSYLFLKTPFNQDISRWDVSNVINMTSMLKDTPFNQDISGWCVPWINERPTTFSNMLIDLEPNWGACNEYSPSSIVKLSPDSAIINTPLSPLFRWATDTLANKYELVIFDSDSSVKVSILTTGIEFQYLEKLESNSTYQWNVRGINVNDFDTTKIITSEWGNIWKFKTQVFPSNKITLKTPTTDTTGLNPSLKLVWFDDQPSDSFQVEVSDNNFETLIFNKTVSDTTISLDSLELGNKYYWRVRGVNSLGGGEWSDIWNFEIHPNITITEKGIVTCKTTPVGFKRQILGETYEVVDRSSLTSRIRDGVSANTLCVSNITNMSSLFNVSEFNQPLDKWDVSNVTNMSKMFRHSSFNQKISSWDVSSVTDMSEMFEESTFNQPINNWDVSSVTDMSLLFYNSDFNQPIGNWDVSSVTNMRLIFGHTNFNKDISGWDVSSVTNMSDMFYNSDFNQPIGNWDVSSVTNMSIMFGYSKFNQPIDNWDVSSVTNMHGMFFYNNHFNQDISDWKVHNVKDMSLMFMSSVFNQDISNWCVPLITSQPKDFVDNNSQLESKNIPVWGSCPGTPNIPTRVYPTNNQVNIPLDTKFRWRLDTLSTTYQIQLFQGFETLLFDTLVYFNNFKLNTNLEQNTTHYWRVKSYNDNIVIQGDTLQSEWSGYWSFTTGVFQRIDLKSPSNDTLLIGKDVTFNWTTESSSEKYNLQISSDDFETLHTNEITTNNTAILSELSYDTKYSWRVRAISSTDTSNWTEVWDFTTMKSPLSSPVLSTPFNDQVNVGTLTEFTWNEVESSVSYHLQVSSDDQFSSAVFDSSKVGSISFTLSEPLNENTTYFWRMKSISNNELRNSEWSDTLTFTTGVRTSIEDELIPQEYILSQNYPNPFNPSTQIQYALPEATQVTLDVFNSLGQKVIELVNGQKSAGYHTATFDASGLSSGVYLYKLTTPSFSQTNKMLLIK